jgi:hypothetical protein
MDSIRTTNEKLKKWLVSQGAVLYKKLDVDTYVYRLRNGMFAVVKRLGDHFQLDIVKSCGC